MAYDRKFYTDKISHYLAILKADLEQHQNLNDLSLNISAENFFRDILRVVRKWPDLENLNFFEPCAKSVDLICKSKKKIIQVTSTTSATKLAASLEALKDSKYKGYTIEILYLIDVPKFSKLTRDYIQAEFGVDCDNVVFGRGKLLKEIENLEQREIEELAYNYFSDRTMRYTDNIVLQIACRNLVDKMQYVSPNVNGDYKVESTVIKIATNKLDETIKKYSTLALDYTWIVLGLEDRDLQKLHQFVVQDLYVNFLISMLSQRGIDLPESSACTHKNLNVICAENRLDMSSVIKSVHHSIKDELTIKDFNGIHIPWIILFSFFEICDIGYVEDYEAC